MKKSITSREYKVFLTRLSEAREASGLTQVALAEALGESQSKISKMERGERRIDVIELYSICEALGVSPSEFVTSLYAAFARHK